MDEAVLTCTNLPVTQHRALCTSARGTCWEETCAVTLWAYGIGFPFLTPDFLKMGMHVCLWRRSCLWVLVSGEGVGNTFLFDQKMQFPLISSSNEWGRDSEFPEETCRSLLIGILKIQPVSLQWNTENCTEPGVTTTWFPADTVVFYYRFPSCQHNNDLCAAATFSCGNSTTTQRANMGRKACKLPLVELFLVCWLLLMAYGL